MIEVYRSVYRVRQELLSLKEGLEVKKSSGVGADSHRSCGEQSDSSDAEEESASLQAKPSGILKQTQSKYWMCTGRVSSSYFWESFLFSPIFLRKPPIFPMFWFMVYKE